MPLSSEEICTLGGIAELVGASQSRDTEGNVRVRDDWLASEAEHAAKLREIDGAEAVLRLASGYCVRELIATE